MTPMRLADAAKPIRIQRRRVKGWRMPENTVYVGRGSKWGNPYTVVNEDMATLWVASKTELLEVIPDDVECPQSYMIDYWRERHSDTLPNLEELRGKNLACWCDLDQPCHADVLLELANK